EHEVVVGGGKGPGELQPDPRGRAGHQCRTPACHGPSVRRRGDRRGRRDTVVAMRLATWNVNSIRTRVDRVIAFLDRSGTDVLAMQETKCRDEQFPLEAFTAAGYEVALHGLSQWNGVAVASRVGLSDVEVGFPGMPTWGDP